MIKNVFFDFNGTLLDDLNLCFKIEEEIIDMYGLKPVTMDFYLDNFCFPVKKYYERAGFDFSKHDYAEISKIFFQKYNEREEKETNIYPKVKETLDLLKKQGYSLYCYSASERKLLEKQLKFFGIFDFFVGIIASDNIKAKGKLEYGKEYIENNKIDPLSTVMIGDTHHDYEVARELGLKPLLVSFGHNSLKVLQGLNTPIINKFEDIPSALKNL